MNQLITIELKDDNAVVSARQLHKTLEVKTRFSQWVEQNFKMFQEGEDFSCVVTTTQQNQYGGLKEIQDYAVTLRMAEHLAMMSKTPKGYEVREYFIQVEKDFNSPEKIMARALRIADNKINKLEAQMEVDKPKVLFANAVSASQTSILIGDFAKLLRQNGLDIGQNRLFIWLRENGFLINRKGDSWNMPTQRSMDRGLFEIKERTHHEPNGTIRISKTTKITGKGQVYFMEKLLAEVA